MTRLRGNAVPETALIMATVLLVLFGFIQVATAEFYQISADGATFVGAHDAVAKNPTAPAIADAKTSIKAAFSKLVANAAGVTTTAAGKSAFETDVTTTIPGVTGFANGKPITLVSRDVEPMTGAAGSSQKLDCATGAVNVGATGSTSGTVTAFVTSPPASAMTTVALTGPPALVSGGGTTYMTTTSVTPPELTSLTMIDKYLSDALALGPSLSLSLKGGLTAPFLGPISVALDAQLSKAELGTFATPGQIQAAAVSAAITQIFAQLQAPQALLPTLTTLLTPTLNDFYLVNTYVLALHQADTAAGATPCP